MEKDRILAFSDGVLAIIITIMVLELKVPHGDDWATLAGLRYVFYSYVLSFIYVAIYWNNHHHLMHVVGHVSGSILWANMHLLFWLSLVPFTTGWMGENHFTSIPTAIYGVSLLMPAIAYWILQTILIRHEGPNSRLARAVGRDLKGKASPVLYAIAIPLSLIEPLAGAAIYALVALLWLIPDRRIERMIAER